MNLEYVVIALLVLAAVAYFVIEQRKKKQPPQPRVDPIVPPVPSGHVPPGAVPRTPPVFDQVGVGAALSGSSLTHAPVSITGVVNAEPVALTLRTSMHDSYPTAQAIQSDADAIGFANQITVDGEEIHKGFGPALAFYKQPDGTFATTKPAPAPQPAPAPVAQPAPHQPSLPSAPGDFASYLQPPAMPTPNGGAITYPVASLTDADKFFLYRMDYWYKGALAHIPGSHQLFRDMLVDGQGHTVWQGANIEGAINQAINFGGMDNAALAQQFDVKAYTGPLAQIYSNLVAAKRG